MGAIIESICSMVTNVSICFLVAIITFVVAITFLIITETFNLKELLDFINNLKKDKDKRYR